MAVMHAGSKLMGALSRSNRKGVRNLDKILSVINKSVRNMDSVPAKAA
jgi:hypothetical protein